MPIKIAYISNVKFPSHDAVSEQVISNLAALAEITPEITLIIPNFNELQSSVSDIEKFYNVKVRFQIKFLRYSSFLIPSIIKKIHAIVSPVYAFRMKYDLIYTRHPAILFFCLLLRINTIFETYRIDINYLPRYRFWKWFCYRNPYLLGFIVHSNLARKALLENGVDDKKILLAYNGYAAKKNTGQEVVLLREKFHITQEEIVVAYAGRISTKAKRTDILLQLAKRLPDIKFLIIGAGKRKEDDRVFNQIIEEMQLKNVIRTGWVDPAVVQDYLQVADILIIPPSSDPLQRHGRTVLPMKTFMYMAAGKAIVAPDLPDIREILRNEINAMLVEPDNFDDLIKKIQTLIENVFLRKKLAQQCLIDIEEYTWSKRAQRIHEFLISVMKKEKSH